MTRNESGRGDLDVARQRDTGKPSITEAAQERVHEVTDKAASELDAVSRQRVRATARRAAAGAAAVLTAVFIARTWRRRRARKNVGPLQSALDQARSLLGSTGGQAGKQARRRAAKAKAGALKAKAGAIAARARVLR